MPRFTPLVSILVVVAVHGINRECRAGDIAWTGWLGGPERTAWVSGFQPPDRWPDELTEIWQVEVGTGYGSPLVSGGRVYQHARLEEYEVIWCLDVESGDLIWRERFPVPFTIGGGGEYHGKGPKSSPALADDRLFTMSITGVLSAWDAGTGDLLWRRDDSGRYQPPHPNWGAATSPLVDGDRVVIHLGNDDDGSLVALDARTGEEIWSQGTDGPSYASAFVATIDGVRQIVEWNHRALVGIESQSGVKLWEYPMPHIGMDQNMPTPIFHEGLVLLGGENRGLRAIEPRHKDDEWTAEEVWFQKDVALDMSTATVNDGLVFGFSHYDSGRLFCLDPQSGDVLWQGPPRTGQNVMFLSVPGHVLALIDNGQLRVIAATGDQLNHVATYQVSENATWAPPTLLEDSVLIKDRNALKRLSMAR